MYMKKTKQRNMNELLQDFTPADNSLFNAKVLYGIFKTNNLFLNRKCQKMFLKRHFQFFQSREL